MTPVVRAFLKWLPLGVAITLLCVLIYATVQQNYRQSANDPQIQMAEDAAALIGEGSSPSSVVPASKVNFASSLAPWVAVYDANGTVLASSGLLNGAPPKFPPGVFDSNTWHTYAEDGFGMPVPNDEDRFSWQPQPDVRQAVVLVRASNGDLIAAGRNIREVEDREGVLTEMIAVGWLVTIIATLVAQVVAEWLL